MCYLRRLKISQYVTLTEEGCVGINKASHDKNLDIPDIIFTEHFNIIVHKVCRSRHTNTKSIKKCPKTPNIPVFCIQKHIVFFVVMS